MSLAYKLWKIGNVLEQDEMRECIQEDIPEKVNDPTYININFTFNKENNIESILLKHDGVSKDKFFFSKKIGGSGSGIYYLYPNLIVQKEKLGKKVEQIKNTLSNICLKHANNNNSQHVRKILEIIENKNNKKGKVENEWEQIFSKIDKSEKADYILFLSINGKTFYEQMPEIWINWFNAPATKNSDAKIGYDAFTNEETEIGYRPEVKVFSYDQYHDHHNHRINENLPLSQQSARNIKFAWIYILNKLVFNYKGLEYVIIPNLLTDDSEIYQTVLKRLVSANKKSTEKKNMLKTLHDKEAKIEKDLEKLRNEKVKLVQKKTEAEKNKKYNQINNEIQKKEKEYTMTKDEIQNKEIGLISEFNNQVDEIGELKNSITLDYLFTSINKTDLSFDIKGSIEDVIPSKFTQIVKAMDKNDIDDKISLKMKNRKQNLLQNYFNRNELYLACNRSTLDDKYKLKNVIVKERIELARLLLTEEKISMEQLLKKFEYHRQKRYDLKKRVTKEGTKEWIEYSHQFVLCEQHIYHFFQSLDKIKE